MKIEYKMDENKLFKLFKLILQKIILENMKITPKTVIVFLLHMYGFASEILKLTTQFENCKWSTWMPELAKYYKPSIALPEDNKNTL